VIGGFDLSSIWPLASNSLVRQNFAFVYDKIKAQRFVSAKLKRIPGFLPARIKKDVDNQETKYNLEFTLVNLILVAKP
jgi:hypothetical protein